jgi:hypothetical protein
MPFYNEHDYVHSYKRRRGESKDSWRQRQLGTNSAAVNQVGWKPTVGKAFRELIRGGVAFPPHRKADISK